MAEWMYRIHRMELPQEADNDEEMEKVLEEFGAQGWELVQILHRHKVPEDPIHRFIFKIEKPVGP